ncbi:MAG: hypothetical protein COA54_05925 [Thiotrichaceae bacterium]|nr:MAG: hypothetical protein COA54_05925 [Thiotrichaceae bacterium]
MTASSNTSFWTLFACAVLGAFLGDMLGFWLGRFGAHKWQPHILSNHRQRTAKRAHELINKHGLLALFLGRFVWLIHPAISGAAGLLGVKTNRFILVGLPAILLWVLFYRRGRPSVNLFMAQSNILVSRNTCSGYLVVVVGTALFKSLFLSALS